MDPVMISLIVTAIAEALKFAMDGAKLIEDGQDMTPEEVQALWTAMNDRYAASRRKWDDAGTSTREI
jgi:hypothetical protein